MPNELQDALDRYQESIPRFDRWSEAECVGYYGYGSGRAAEYARKIAAITRKPAETPCTTCPKAQECWNGLRAKARELMPEMTKAFEKLAKKYQGERFFRKWQKLTKQRKNRYMDPYLMLNLMHMERGIVDEACKLELSREGDRIDIAMSWPSRDEPTEGES